MYRIATAILLWSAAAVSTFAGEKAPGPFDAQVASHGARLRAEAPATRAGAAEALGFLRAYAAEGALIERLEDPSTDVRRQAAMALALGQPMPQPPPEDEPSHVPACPQCEAAMVFETRLTFGQWHTRFAGHPHAERGPP